MQGTCLRGSNQKIPSEFARALQPLGENADYVQVSGNGSNALDFHIAFTIGELSKANAGVFHIISKDLGFDPLIKYLKTKHIVAYRWKALTDVPFLRPGGAKTEPNRLDVVVNNLKSRGSGRPRKVTTLSNTINALFSNSLEQAELGELVQTLIKRGYIRIDGEIVSYHLP